MKAFLLGLLLVGAALEVPPPLVPYPQIIAQQIPVEPPIYPEGTLCTPNGDNVHGLQTPDHPCMCARMSHGTDCESDVHEDAACKQFCHAQHCGCPLLCGAPDDHGEADR